VHPDAPAEDHVPPARRDRWQRRLARTRTVAAVLLAGVLRWALRLGLPLAGAAALLHAFPYRTSIQGLQFTVEGSLFGQRGLTADTTLGSWVFPDIDGLPFGVHVTPRDVDVLKLTQAAGSDRSAFVGRLQADALHEVPHVVVWLVGELVVGAVLGLAVGAAVNMSVRYLRGLDRRPRELRLRALQLAAAFGVLLVVAGYGLLSYQPHWVRQSRLTGTLAAAQLFPQQLSQYYTQQSKAFDVLGSVLGLQAAVQTRIDQTQTPATALRIMFISDMHLAANYPLVQQYAASYDVDLIINTGDESEFGSTVELTPSYLDALRATAAATPMLWLAGNHDSPQVEQIMASIPGITVLGSKTSSADGYTVSAGSVSAFGLTVAGLPDPRVYGGPGAYGADDTHVTDPLERSAVDDAVADLSGGSAGSTRGAGSPDGETFDIFATHEPVAAGELRDQLPGRIRQTASGHLHKQNAPGDLQHGDGSIDLVEGSTGAGGLDNIVRGEDRPPIEFSIESVGADCQFTRIVRFQINSAQPTSAQEPATPQAYGDDVTASTIYFRPQALATGRSCGASLGISAEAPL
jgi:predicted MPP superfamily phosphohydrolase